MTVMGHLDSSNQLILACYMQSEVSNSVSSDCNIKACKPQSTIQLTEVQHFLPGSPKGVQ